MLHNFRDSKLSMDLKGTTSLEQTEENFDPKLSEIIELANLTEGLNLIEDI